MDLSVVAVHQTLHCLSGEVSISLKVVREPRNENQTGDGSDHVWVRCGQYHPGIGPLEEQIAQIEARLNELQPAVDEAAALERALTSLRREKSKLGAAEQADPAPSDKFDQLMDYQRYLRLSDRQKQVADLLRQDPNLKNVEIAEQLGISPARVGQVRRTLT